jgi:hypothetical protein
LLESGAIYQRFDIDSEPATPTTAEPTRDVYVADPERWIVERAGRFARSGMQGKGHQLAEDEQKSGVGALVDNVKTKLGFSGPEGKEGQTTGAVSTNDSNSASSSSATATTADQDILVSAPGKVILFGEHAVVHGVVR